MKINIQISAVVYVMFFFAGGGDFTFLVSDGRKLLLLKNSQTLQEADFRGQTIREVLPPDELPVSRHNANRFKLDDIGGENQNTAQETYGCCPTGWGGISK